MSTHYVTHEQLKEFEDRIMSALSDSIAKLAAAADAVVALVGTQKSEIAALQADAATPADHDAIAKVQAALDGVLSPPPAPTA